MDPISGMKHFAALFHDIRLGLPCIVSILVVPPRAVGDIRLGSCQLFSCIQEE